MPDKRKHRGPHPADEHLFAPSQLPNLQAAVRDLSWLLSRGYADKSSLKLVGDRFELRERQRNAVVRCSCSDEALKQRLDKQVKAGQLKNERILIDGYNVLTTLEASLSGAVIIKGRDGTFRDIAGVHGTHRKVEETIPAIELIGEFLLDKGASECIWYLDSPVSNSGRLKTLLYDKATEHNWNWQAELVYNPDNVLSQSKDVVASSDSEILNRCKRWFNLAAAVITESPEHVWLIDLS